MKAFATPGALSTRALLAAALVACVFLWSVAARSAGPSPVDPDFLEFLGSIDSEGDGWGDFLSRVNLDKQTPPAPPARSAEPATPPPVRVPAKEPAQGAGK